MIEITILDFLKKNIPVPCFLERPQNPPQRYVLMEKTGSAKANHIHTSTIVFQSYAESLYQAALLNEQVKVMAERLMELDEVSKAKLNSDYHFTDPQTKQYRYQAVFDIKHY